MQISNKLNNGNSRYTVFLMIRIWNIWNNEPTGRNQSRHLLTSFFSTATQQQITANKLTSCLLISKKFVPTQYNAQPIVPNKEMGHNSVMTLRCRSYKLKCDHLNFRLRIFLHIIGLSGSDFWTTMSSHIFSNSPFIDYLPTQSCLLWDD